MGESVWDALQQQWLDDDYKKMCARNAANRASSKGGSLHTGGSINSRNNNDEDGENIMFTFRVFFLII